MHAFSYFVIFLEAALKAAERALINILLEAALY
jgi:hypothetical protein